MIIVQKHSTLILNLMIIKYRSRKTIENFSLTGTVKNITVLFRVAVIKKTLIFVSTNDKITQSFIKSLKFARINVIFGSYYLIFIRLNFVIDQICWDIQGRYNLSNYIIITVVNLFIILIALRGLVHIENCHFRYICLVQLHGCC